MYTQCPDCRSAFRVVAADLRQAAGKVRCGDCGAAFDALLYLSEDLPEPQGDATSEPVLPELKHASRVGGLKLPESISANESIALLQTLDELAGSDIRIEDTGIEWQVLDEVAMSEMGTDAVRADDQPAPEPEVRYDDDSPLPDKLATDNDVPPDNEADNVIEEVAVGPEPQLQVDDIDATEIDDSGDWEAILDEFDEQASESIADDVVDDDPRQSDDAALQAAEDPGDDESSDDGQDQPGDEDSSDESQNEPGDDIEIVLEGDDDAVDYVEVDEEAAAGTEPQSGEPSDEDGSPSQWQLLDEDEQEESIPTLGEPLKVSPAADIGEEPSDDGLVTEVDFGVESIVMEGDSVRIALDDMEAAASLRAAADEPDFGATYTSVPPTTRSMGRRIGLLFVMLLLLVVLGLQAVHQQRETLAKIPAVNEIIGPLYRMVGKPLTPAWDVSGWSFEATTGNAENNDEQLNIYTRIGNHSDEALPYPLIGISLTDRYGEIIGSRILEPSSYLATDLNPRKLIAPGESFEAFFAVESPDVEASGYKLDVCYRLPDRRLRCAISDFR